MVSPYGYICWILSVVAVTYGIEIVAFESSGK
jgi:hypothetical protein